MSPSVQEAQLLSNRYRLVERLGQGGMSLVWRAHDEVLGRDVAVKVLTPRFAENHIVGHRMRVEAQAVARLCHPHITAVYDYGEAPAPGGRTVPYVVMELIDGVSLSSRLNGGGLYWADAVAVCAQVASALAAAHAHGIVHRDVTPANVMLTRGGAKVVDFGISALAGERDTSPDGSLFGTPAYLAPERLDGGAVEPATDVYALGVLLYKSLAGRLPWPIMNTTQMLRAHRLAEPAPLPSSVAAEVPPQVIDLCRRCLAKRPQDRPASGEAARTLAGAVHIIVPLPTDRVVAARSPVRPVEPSIEPQEQTTMSWQLDLQPNDGEPAPGADGAGVVVVADRGEIVVAADADEFVVAPDGGEIAADADEIMVPADDGRADEEEEDDQGEGKLRRRNAIVVMATVALLTAVAWAGVRPASGGSAAGASAGGKPQASVAPAEGQRCRVHYQVHEDWGSGFRAGVAVTNEGSMALRDWQLAFAFASDQRVVGAGAAKWHQSGQNVVAGPSEPDRRLYPGSSAEFDLTGRYVRANPLPAAFDLDGVACKTVVTPAASPTPTPEPGSPKPTPEPGPAKGDQMKPRVKGA